MIFVPFSDIYFFPKHTVVPMLDTANQLKNLLSLFSCIFGSVNDTFLKFTKNFMNAKTLTKYTHFQTQLFSLRCVVPYKVSVSSSPPIQSS